MTRRRLCRHADEHTATVTSHRGATRATAYTCRRPRCIGRAITWAEHITNRPATHAPFEEH